MRWWIGAVAVVTAGVVVGFGPSAVLGQGKGDPKAGEAVYKVQCAKCHGDKGAGDGPQGRKLKNKPSNWTASGAGLKGMDDQKIFNAISKGGAAVGKSKAMPAYPKLSEQEVWNLVAYVKSLMK